MFIESAGGHIPSTYSILCPNDHEVGKCGVIRQSRLRVIFNTYILVWAAEGGQRDEVQSRSNLDLAPSSELRY